jgi:hypothetical protein
MRAASLLCLTFLFPGCYGSAWDKTEVPPPSAPTRDEALWSQYCTYHGATDLAEINAWLQELGQQGWQLVGIGGQTATVYCFKARLAESQSASEARR